jgi:hypothetical protein
VNATARRLFWFVGLWAGGVIVVGAVALIIRAVFGV